MFKCIAKDLAQFTHGTKLRDKLKVIILSPGFMAVLLIRIQIFFYSHNMLVCSYLIHRMNLNLHGIDVLPGARIAGGLRIEHPSGVVIGAGCIIDSNCTIMQGVTLGVKNVSRERNDNCYPVIGSNVIIGANASILGGITIGDGVKIGAHALILKDCLPGTIWVLPDSTIEQESDRMDE